MNTSLNHGSAKIYQFPAGGRAALGGRRYEETKTVTERVRPYWRDWAKSRGPETEQALDKLLAASSN